MEAISFKSRTKSKATRDVEQPKRLSKFAEWRKQHPNGIIKVLDWKAVNR
jgi:hypothetical protein